MYELVYRDKFKWDGKTFLLERFRDEKEAKKRAQYLNASGRVVERLEWDDESQLSGDPGVRARISSIDVGQ